jgi:O-antigen ligase
MTSAILKHVYSAFSIVTGARYGSVGEVSTDPAALGAPFEFQRRTLTAVFYLFLVALFFSISAMEIAAWSLVATILISKSANRFRRLESPASPSLVLGCEALLLFFFTSICVSAMVRVPTIEGCWDVISEMRWIVVLYGLTFVIRSELAQRSERLLLFTTPLFIFVGLYAVLQFATGRDLLIGRHDFLKPFGASTYRAVGFFNIPLTFAYSYGVLGSVFSVWYFFRFATISTRGRWLGGVAVVCICAGILASGVRGAWLASGVTVVSILPFLRRRTALLTAACFIAMVATLILSSESIRLRAASMILIQESSNAGRVKIWRGHLAIARDYPLLGVGLGQTGNHLGKYYQQMGIRNGQIGHAHNNFIEYLAGTGMVGLTFYLLVSGFFLVASLLAFRRQKKSGAPDGFFASLAVGCFAAQIYMHTGGLTEVNFTDGEVNHALMLVWALTLGVKYKREAPASGSSPSP